MSNNELQGKHRCGARRGIRSGRTGRRLSRHEGFAAAPRAGEGCARCLGRGKVNERRREVPDMSFLPPRSNKSENGTVEKSYAVGNPPP